MSYQNLEVWRMAMDLAVEVYSLTRRFPQEELYNLTFQLRRSAVSVPSNIAEGQGRYSTRENKQFVMRARGSLLELETQILLASRLHYLDDEALNELMKSSAKVGRKLNGLVRYLSKRSSSVKSEIRDPRSAIRDPRSEMRDP